MIEKKKYLRSWAIVRFVRQKSTQIAECFSLGFAKAAEDRLPRYLSFCMIFRRIF